MMTRMFSWRHRLSPAERADAINRARLVALAGATIYAIQTVGLLCLLAR